MKGSKYLLLLAAFMVSFGLVGVANAATVKSIEVTSPDSGVVKGIDSTFVVTAKILDLSPVDSLEVVMYLTTSSDSVVVADTSSYQTEWGGLKQETVIGIARDRNMGRAVVNQTKLTDGQDAGEIRAAKGANQNSSLVAVQQKRARA